MKEIVEGHVYELDRVFRFTTENEPMLSEEGLRVEFMRRGVNGQVNWVGTTNEEVLAMMIARMEYLDAKQHCPENESCIRHLRHALAALEERTARRKAQGVEGTDKPHTSAEEESPAQ